MENKNLIKIPTSKSQTIRAILISTFSFGISTIKNPLFSDDTRSCISACEALGASFSYNEETSLLTIDSTLVNTFTSECDIDCGNSGTTLYLIMGLCATLNRKITLLGDEQLNARPVKALVDAYKTLGVDITCSDSNTPPIVINGPSLIGGNVEIACPTSQYLSSLLLSLPLAQKESEVTCSLLYEKPYVKLTTTWLDDEEIEYSITSDFMKSTISPLQTYKPLNTTIWGDYSSATFFFALAAASGKSISVSGLNKDDDQGDKEILNILSTMGCKISWFEDTVTVTGPAVLKGGSFDLNAMPDSLPALSALALFSSEDVSLINVPQARIKETDRISVMTENLTALGASITELEDGMIIKGNTSIKAGNVNGYKDHRIIMALAVINKVSSKEIVIDDISAVSVTFPSFFSLIKQLTF